MLYNGTKITKMIYNGANITKVFYNGSDVFGGATPPPSTTSPPPPTTTPPPPATNELVINGDFSSGSKGWTVYGNWNFSTGQAVLTPAKPYEQCYQIIPVVPGNRYIVNAYCSSKNGDGAVHLYYLNASNAIISVAYNIHFNPNLVITTPANCSKIEILLVNNNTNTKTIIFDNISLKPYK